MIPPLQKSIHTYKRGMVRSDSLVHSFFNGLEVLVLRKNSHFFLMTNAWIYQVLVNISNLSFILGVVQFLGYEVTMHCEEIEVFVLR